MTDASPALRTHLAYFTAWTSGDFDAATAFVTDDVICNTPAGRLHGAAAFRRFMEPFSHILTRSELLAAYGDERTSLIMYDTDTIPVQGAPGAERAEVTDGRITQLWIVFDRLPFDAARPTVQLG